VAVLSADLSTVLYATYLGGSGEDSFRDVVADAAGNFCFAGATRSPDFPPRNAAPGISRGNSDLVIGSMTGYK
jgi:hypothetical protein